MRNEVLKSLYDLHSWIGLVSGVFLFAVVFSGTLALFDHEFGPWLRDEVTGTPPMHPRALDGAIADLLPVAEQTGGTLFIRLPTPFEPYIAAAVEKGDTLTVERYYDPSTGVDLPPPTEAATDVMMLLHTDLLLPWPYGRYFVGILGVFMLVLVFSGIFLHRKMVRELFTLRLHRSVRLMWTDTHKSVALWGLPFHLVLSLTGAILGLVAVTLLLGAGVSYKGDLAAAATAFGIDIGAPEDMARVTTALPSERLLEIAMGQIEGMSPEHMAFKWPSGAHPQVRIAGNVDGALVFHPGVYIDAVTGEVAKLGDWRRETAMKRVYAMITPLHYGSFGGVAVKLIYAILGSGMCLLTLSGLKIWLARRSEMRGDNGQGAFVWDRLFEGACYGLPLASVVLYGAVKLAPADIGSDDGTFTWVFLGLWIGFAAAIGFRTGLRNGADCRFVGGMLLLCYPLATVVNTGLDPVRVILSGGIAVAAVDIAAMVLGLVLVLPTAVRGVTALRVR